MLRKILAVTTLSVASASAYAQSGFWDFTLENKSDHPIVSFQTAEPNKNWSKNWLNKGQRILPGRSAKMHWASDSGPCVHDFLVISDDGYQHEFSSDFCDLNKLSITNDSAYRN